MLKLSILAHATNEMVRQTNPNPNQ